MARASILDRFRPVGAPGPAGSTGVPSDDVRGPAWELAPVFAALQPDIDRAQDSIAAAMRAAATLRQTAATRADEIRAQASIDATAARARAATRVTRAAAKADVAHRAAAEKAATVVDASADARLDAVAAEVVERLTDELREP